jgi:hypothetical protein
MALLDLQGMETAGGKGGGGSTLSVTVCNGGDSGLSLLLCK